MTTHVLIIDDDPVEVSFLRRAFSDIQSSARLHHMENAKEAIAELEAGHYDLVLLDISMPEHDGFEVMEMIRHDGRAAMTPVIMFSSSNAHDDVRRAYAVGANSYAEKPNSREGYRKFAEAFTRFWVDTAVTPH